ncbi:hypothetical protein KSX_34200 [Ktedonospora formicarum]|uniref:GrpB family protein n=2 Tax=Ktedonospora formicarum TaxID=2778364 RepID=A0A8J3HW99_9CHLR|nr:hypothetical protein KSX_34200 [Ktedonospora formicarum]
MSYDVSWPHVFEKERTLIEGVIGAYAEEIQHIGSTSIPGLSAKPIIDILVIVRSLDLVAECVGPLEALDYMYRGENGIPERHYFVKPHGVSSFEHLFHLHMIERTSEQMRMVRFRDYLIAHPEARQAYQELKIDLAARYGSDRVGYTDAKADFVLDIVRKAEEECHREGGSS